MDPIDPSKALVLLSRPEMQAGNARRVRRGFWRKLRRYAAFVPFSDHALAAFYCAGDKNTPPQVRAVILAALAYFMLPTDAVPDFLAAIGFGDDAAVFWAAWAIVDHHISPDHRDRAKAWFAVEGEAEDAELPANPPIAADIPVDPMNRSERKRFWRLMRRA